jgi:hypothetical protein
VLFRPCSSEVSVNFESDAPSSGATTSRSRTGLLGLSVSTIEGWTIQRTGGVTYAKAFFDLQLQFAHKVTALSGLPLARVLLEYSNLYIRFGLGRDFDPAHPVWQEYLAGLQDTNDIGEWTYSFYLKRPDAMAAPSVVANFGCFAYARSSGERIRLHFQNAETDEH